MARLLLAIFLVSVSFRLLADFSIIVKSGIYAQLVQDPQESQKEDPKKGIQEVKFTFHFIRLIPGHLLLKERLKAALRHGEPSPGFINVAFTPPEPVKA